MRAASLTHPRRDALPAASASHGHGAIHGLIGAWLLLQLFYTTSQMPFQANWGVNVTPDRVALLGVLLLFGARLLSERSTLLPGTATELMMLLLCLLATASLIASGANADVSRGQNRWASSLFSFFIAPYGAYYISKNLACAERTLRRYLALFALLGLYLGLTGVFEILGPHGLVFPAYIMDPALGIHFGRARGPMLNAGFLGQLLIFCLFLTLLLAQQAGRLARLLCLAAGLVMLAGIYLTYTRGPWLALAAGLAVMLAARSRLRRYALTCCLVILAVALLGVTTRLSLESPTLFSERRATVYDRINIMAATVRMIADHPWLGVGYGKFNEEYPRYWGRVKDVPLTAEDEPNHNVPLGVMAELGAVGLLCYLGILAGLARAAGRLYRAAPEGSLAGGLAVTQLACLASYFVNMQTLDVRWNMLQNVTPFLLAGLLAALAGGRAAAAGGGGDGHLRA